MAERRRRRARNERAPTRRAPETAPSARVPGEVKVFVVQQLAHFVRVKHVQAAVREQFGIEMSRQAIERYDPTRAAGRSLSQQLRTLFEQTREAYIRDTSDIPSQHRAWRMRELHRLYAMYEDRGMVTLLPKLIEQFARDWGYAYENRRVITSDDPTGELAKMLGLTREEFEAAAGPAGQSPESDPSPAAVPTRADLANGRRPYANANRR